MFGLSSSQWHFEDAPQLHGLRTPRVLYPVSGFHGIVGLVYIGFIKDILYFGGQINSIRSAITSGIGLFIKGSV